MSVQELPDLTKVKDSYIGRRFGRLVVVRRASVERIVQKSGPQAGQFYYRRTYTCRCDCGTVKDYLRQNLLANGPALTVSCGCHRADLMQKQREDFVGTKIGKVIAIDVGKDGTIAKPKFRCHCGVEFYRDLGYLKEMSEPHCGCLTSEHISKAQGGPVNLKGRRFSHWKVLGLARKYERPTRWVCRCDCSTVKEVIGTNLTRGLSKSCGCRGKR